MAMPSRALASTGVSNSAVNTMKVNRRQLMGENLLRGEWNGKPATGASGPHENQNKSIKTESFSV
jgi:hypothetical protein